MSDALHPESHGAPARRLADGLTLAAAPTFLVMALLTRLFGDAGMAAICSGAQGPSLLGGMVPMYLLMGAFHTAPWLRLAARGRTTGLETGRRSP